MDFEAGLKMELKVDLKMNLKMDLKMDLEDVFLKLDLADSS